MANIVWVVSEAYGKHENIAVFNDRDKLIDWLIANKAYSDGGEFCDNLLDDFIAYAELNGFYAGNGDDFDEWMNENYDIFEKFVKQELEKDIYSFDDYVYNICSFNLNDES